MQRRKWLAIATIFLFWQKLGLFFVKYLRFFAVVVACVVGVGLLIKFQGVHKIISAFLI
jgi:hypothetical protein